MDVEGVERRCSHVAEYIEGVVLGHISIVVLFVLGGSLASRAPCGVVRGEFRLFGGSRGHMGGGRGEGRQGDSRVCFRFGQIEYRGGGWVGGRHLACVEVVFRFLPRVPCRFLFVSVSDALAWFPRGAVDVWGGGGW